MRVFQFKEWLRALFFGLRAGVRGLRVNRVGLRRPGTIRKLRSGRNGVEVQRLESRTCLTVGPLLIEDIAAQVNTGGSSVSNLTDVNGIAYFTANTPTTGVELWRSDGTTAGTWIVKDIQAGTSSSNPVLLTNVNGTLYFRAADSSFGAELWKSDGTAAGTVLVADLNPGTGSSTPASLTNFNGKLFFSALTGAAGNELFESDGTTSGTLLIEDINPGFGSSNPQYLVNANGTLFFSASNGTTGAELWKSDGTTGGTVPVIDLNPGSSGSSPNQLTAVGSSVVFRANDGTSGVELWASNGTELGTILLADGNPGLASSNPQYLMNVNGTVYFQATDPTNGTELWKTDGSSAGTSLVKDIQTGSSSSNPSQLVNLNGQLIFRAGNAASGIELWTSDGTAGGTVVLKDVRPGTGDSSPTSLTVVNNTLYFAAANNGSNREIWSSDGTEVGTVLVAETNPGTASANPTQLANVGGTLFYRATDGVHGDELFRVNSTGTGVLLVKDLVGTNGSDPQYLTNYGGTLFFRANDGTSGPELWRSDGTAAGTSLAVQLVPGSSGSNIKRPLVVNGLMYFSAFDSTNGDELRVSDGTAGGTSLLANIRPGSGSSVPANLINVNGTLFFRANDGTNGYELWKSDGTSGGTVLVADLTSGNGNSTLSNFTAVNSTLFFTFSDGVNGEELWKSDGTAAGTVLVKDIRTGSASSFPTQLVNLNNVLYFRANDGTTGSELWRSDGTDAGTVQVADIYTGANSSNLSQLTVVNDRLFFQATNGTAGYELWSSDGGSNGATLVRDIRPGFGGSGPTNLTNANGTLFFTANDGTHGAELWTSDGSGPGTFLVRDIAPGPMDGSVSLLTNLNGLLAFKANDLVTGNELWQSDGTTAGTIPFDTALPGGVDPTNLLAIGAELYYSGQTDAEGRELFYYDASPDGAPSPEILVSSSGQTLDNTSGILDFGHVQYLTVATRAIQVRNLGTNNLIVQPATVTTGFTLVQNFQTNQIIAPGAVATIMVSIATDAVEDLAGQLMFATNDADEGTYQINLAGSVNTPTLLLQLNGPSTINEADTTPITATLTRDYVSDMGASLVVTLNSSNNLAIYAPVTVTIPAYAASVQVTFEVSNDGEVDGVQDVSISASRSGYRSGFTSISVTDDDTVDDRTLGGRLFGAISPYRYRVLQNIVVNDGLTLTIAPGAELLFDAGRGLLVNGYLDASGTEALPIRFSSSAVTPVPGSWTGVRISTDTAATQSVLRHVDIGYAVTGVGIGAPDNSVSVLIIDSQIHHNSIYGIQASGFGSRSTLVLTDSRIHHNGLDGVSLYATASGSSGTTAELSGSTTATLQGNEIDHNGGAGVTAASSGSSSYVPFTPGGSTTATLIGNFVHHNVVGIVADVDRATGSGIERATVNLTAYHNVVADNQQQGVRISISGPATLNTTVINNTIINNGLEGVQSTLTDVDQMTLRNNIVAFNAGGGIVASAPWVPDEGRVGYNDVFENTLGGNPDVNWINYPTAFGQATTVNGRGTPSDTEFNISVDPLFLGGGDFHLSATSPLIDAGSPQSGAPTADYDGDPIVGQPEIGADEVSPELRVLLDATELVDGVSVVDYGTLIWRNAGLIYTYTLINSGTAPLALQPITVTGAGFSLISINFTPGQLVAPGASVTFRIMCAPNLPGTPSATVSLPTSDTDENPFEFSLIGSVIPSSNPLISGVPVSQTYVEQGAPLFVASAATVTNVNADNFLQGQLRISWTPTNISSDLWTIASEGSGPGQIAILDTSVRYGGVEIGLLTVTPQSLTIDFNENAQAEEVAALLRRIQFTNSSLNPPLTNRTLFIDLFDGHGGIATTVNSTITITPVNDPPSGLFLSATEIPEDLPSGAVVGDFFSIDVDSVVPFTYQLVTGAGATDNGLFQISGNQLHTASSFDFEQQQNYSIRVRTTDAGGQWFETNFTVTITDVNEAPAAILLQNQIVSFGESTSTLSAIKVADILVTDDALGANVLSLAGPDAASFQIVGNELRLRAGTGLDFETKSSYQVTVRVDDPDIGGTPDASASYSLSITDVNEAPIAITFQNVTSSLLEGTDTSTGIKLADIVVTDDALGVRVLSLSGVDAGVFEIVGGELRLMPNVVLDLDLRGSYSVVVNVDDPNVGGTPDASATFVLTVDNVNEPPTAIVFLNAVTTLNEDANTSSAIKLADINVIDDGLGTNGLTLTGADEASFEIVGLELRLKAGVVLNQNVKSSYTVIVNADDATLGGTPDVSATFTLTIVDVNQPPTSVSLQNATTSISEDAVTASAIKLADVVVTDDLLGVNGLSLSGPDAVVFQLVGTELQLKAGISLNFATQSSYSVTISVDDPTVGNTPDASVNYTLTIIDTNDPPTALLLHNQVTSLAENTNTTTSLKLGDIVISDDSLGSNSLSLTGPDASVFQIVGTELRLQSGVVLNFEGQASYSVTITVDDPTIGTTPDVSLVYTLIITNVNEPPTAVVLQNAVTVLAENVNTSIALKLADIVVADDALGVNQLQVAGVDAAFFEIVGLELRLKAGTVLNNEVKSSYSVAVQVNDPTVGATPDASVAFTLNVADQNELPTLALLNPISTLSESANVSIVKLADIMITDDLLGNNTLSLSGPDAAAFEISGLELRFKPGVLLDFETKSSYSVTVNVDDATIGLNPDASVNYSVTLTNANDPATVSIVNVTTSIPENTNLPVALKVADIVVTDDILGTNTLSLSGPDALFFTIVGSQLRLNAGTALNFEAKPTYQVTVNVDDLAVSGAPDGSVNLVLNVSDVNEAPTGVTLVNATTVLPENTSNVVGIALANLVVTDDALGTNSFSLGGSHASSFQIVGTELRLKPGVVLDFETQSSYSVTIRVDDPSVGQSPDASTNFTLTLTNVSEPPTAVNLLNVVAARPENTNSPAGLKLADISVVDDGLGTVVLSLTGADAAAFEIVGNELRLKGSVVLNFESQATYFVTINADDPLLGTTPDASQNFVFQVTDVNERPTSISLQNLVNSLPENSNTGAAIKLADIHFDDDALGVNQLSLAGADAAAFEIVGTELRLKSGIALNFELKSSYSVTVRVDDSTVGGNPDASTNFVLAVTNVNEPPTSINLQNAITTLSEQTSTATPISLADLVVIDDLLGTNTISVTGPDAGAFEIVGSVLRLRAGVSLNSAIQSTYQVTISVDDPAVGGTPDASAGYTLTITSVNAAPTAIGIQNQVTSIPENTSTATGLLLGNVIVTDDAFGTNMLSLSGADAGVFELLGTELRLKSGVSLNFESKSSYSVTVNVDDVTVGGTPDASVTFSLNLQDVNEPPTAITVQQVVASLPENANTISGVKVGEIQVTDDALGANQLTVSGPDAAAFEIVGTELWLKPGAVLNFESQASYSVAINVYDVIVGTSPDASTTFVLNVVNVNEPPTAVVLMNAINTLPEDTNTDVAIKLADLVVNDDALGTNELGLTGPDSGQFQIIGSSLWLRAGVTLDAALQATYSVTITVDDVAVNGSPDATTNFLLSITEVNDPPQLSPQAGTVTFSKKAARQAGPTRLLPDVIVEDPDQSIGQRLGGGILSISISVSARQTRKGAKLFDQISGLDGYTALGTSMGASVTGGQLRLTVALHSATTVAQVQSFLRGLAFSTKGAGMRLATRQLVAQVTDAAGAASNELRRTVQVVK